jgi:hypothetical protein
VTVTASLNVTVTGTACTALYAPLVSVELTPVTVGGVLSTVNALAEEVVVVFPTPSVSTIV